MRSGRSLVSIFHHRKNKTQKFAHLFQIPIHLNWTVVLHNYIEDAMAGITHWGPLKNELKKWSVRLTQKQQWHCVKSVRIWSYSGPYFPAFGLNTERYRMSIRIQTKCGKMQTIITANTDTFHAVWSMLDTRNKIDLSL